jgi:GH25 family lysozyme M1 (1,4-beta-N-acetylmuramidase)
MIYLHGVDISSWEPCIDWNLLRAEGHRFALIRATKGEDVDPLFKQHWKNAQRPGIIRGAYHYLKPQSILTPQINLFLRVVELEQTDLPAVLDLEEKENSGVSNKEFIKCAKVWLDRVEVATERKPIIYSRASFLWEHFRLEDGKYPDWVGEYKFWVAHYLTPEELPPGRAFRWLCEQTGKTEDELCQQFKTQEISKPLEEPGWQPWTFWQYSERAQLDSVRDTIDRKTGVDLNLFRGSLDDLCALAGMDVTDLLKYKLKDGDTYASVAALYGISEIELRAAYPTPLMPGTEISYPPLNLDANPAGGVGDENAGGDAPAGGVNHIHIDPPT